MTPPPELQDRGQRPAPRFVVRGGPALIALLTVASLSACSGQALDPGQRSSGLPVSGAPTGVPSTPAASRAATAAPDFILATVGGETLATASERGRLLILTFTAPDCPTCAKQIPVLDRVAAELAPAGATVAIVDLSGLDDDDALTTAYRGYGWTGRVPIGKDLTFKVARAFGVSRMGETVIVAPDGSIIWQGVWEDEPALIEAIEAAS